MNIFGVGGPELMVILVIMLVFAGPKRMIHWSYILGQYISKFRVMWSQTVDLVQKEFDEAGVDIKLPKEPPTRKNLNKTIADALQPVTKPIQDSMDEVKKDMDSVKAVSDDLKGQTSEISKELKEKTAEPPKEDVKKITGPVEVYSSKKTPKQAEEKAPVASDSESDTVTSSEAEPVTNPSSSLGTWSASSEDK
jgi:Sec-independent protein translocase protein TatA